MKQKQLALLTSSKWRDYELLDSGNARKFERFGSYNFIRPESQAIWEPRLSQKDWHADGVFIPNQDSAGTAEGGWQLSKELPESWILRYGSLRFMGRPTPFRHLGFFPEQAVHWEWCASAIRTFIIKC